MINWQEQRNLVTESNGIQYKPVLHPVHAQTLFGHGVLLVALVYWIQRHPVHATQPIAQAPWYPWHPEYPPQHHHHLDFRQGISNEIWTAENRPFPCMTCCWWASWFFFSNLLFSFLHTLYFVLTSHTYVRSRCRDDDVNKSINCNCFFAKFF